MKTHAGILLTCFLLIGTMIAMIVAFALYPFKIIEFPNTPQVEILNPSKRVPLGGYLTVKMRTVKHWSIGEMTVKTLLSSSTEDRKGTLIPLQSLSSLTNLPLGDNTRVSFFNVLVTPMNIGKDRRLSVTYRYTLFGGRVIDRTSISDPFEVYIPDNFPHGFFEMHFGSHQHLDRQKGLQCYGTEGCDE